MDLKAILQAELAAIKKRFEGKISAAEKAVLDSQFGQRILHLEERLKALEADAAAEPPAVG